MHKYPQNQSYVGSSGKTLTINVYMTLCTWQIRQTHVLCGCTKFGTELIRSLRLLWLGQGRSLYRGGGGYFMGAPSAVGLQGNYLAMGPRQAPIL